MTETAAVPDIRIVVEEFGRVLDVLGRQLDASLLESDREYVAIGVAFQELATAKGHIDSIIGQEPHQSMLRRDCDRIGESLDAAVVALQYHDRLVQRVGHIRRGLDHLQTLLRDGTPRSFDQWLELLRDVERMQNREQRRLAAVSADARDAGDVELFDAP